MQQQSEHGARLLHEFPERRFDPCLDRRDAHGSAPAALIISTRIMPMFAAGSATTTRTRSLWPAAQIRPRSASSCMNVAVPRRAASAERDRKSTRLNSSHVEISYAVFCLKKKKKHKI